jgi:glutamate-1-semialdehyde 2,1-aminomutase
LEEEDPYDELEELAAGLVAGIVSAAADAGVPASGSVAGSMWGVYFCEGPVRNFSDALKVNRELFAAYHRGCLERGIFFAPSAFEAGFVSTAHDAGDIEQTIEVARAALAKAAGAG